MLKEIKGGWVWHGGGRLRRKVWRLVWAGKMHFAHQSGLLGLIWLVEVNQATLSLIADSTGYELWSLYVCMHAFGRGNSQLSLTMNHLSSIGVDFTPHFLQYVVELRPSSWRNASCKENCLSNKSQMAVVFYRVHRTAIKLRWIIPPSIDGGLTRSKAVSLSLFLLSSPLHISWRDAMRKQLPWMANAWKTLCFSHFRSSLCILSLFDMNVCFDVCRCMSVLMSADISDAAPKSSEPYETLAHVYDEQGDTAKATEVRLASILTDVFDCCVYVCPV